MPKKLLVGLNDLASQNTLLSEWCVATFILPEFVNYVFFNLRNLLYLIGKGTVKYYAQIHLQVWQNSVCTGQVPLPLITQ